jgi:hypothetical protein
MKRMGAGLLTDLMRGRMRFPAFDLVVTRCTVHARSLVRRRVQSPVEDRVWTRAGVRAVDEDGGYR